MSELKPKQKRQARIVTLQAIYAKELQGSELDDTCDFMMDADKPPSDNIIKYGKERSGIIRRRQITACTIFGSVA